jgi:DNA-binding IclR family transcriptional regulator
VSATRDPIARAIEVMAWIADHPGEPISVRGLARDIGTSPATVYRILQSFQERSLIERDDHGEYAPGLELHRICAAIAQQLSPARIARPHLESLARQSGEQTILGIYDSQRHAMMFLDTVEASHALRYVVEVNRWLPVHAGASGLAILAFLPAEERQLVYADGLRQVTGNTVVSPAELERVAATVREEGYALSNGQRTPGAVGMAAPIFDRDDRVCGDMCITMPEQRFDPDAVRNRLAPQLIAEAAQLSASLKTAGYRGARAAETLEVLSA